MVAANFATTISISAAGEVSRSSRVPARRSSANWRIVNRGTRSTSCIADWKKMWTRLACLETIKRDEERVAGEQEKDRDHRISDWRHEQGADLLRYERAQDHHGSACAEVSARNVLSRSEPASATSTTPIPAAQRSASKRSAVAGSATRTRQVIRSTSWISSTTSANPAVDRSIAIKTRCDVSTHPHPKYFSRVQLLHGQKTPSEQDGHPIGNALHFREDVRSDQDRRIARPRAESVRGIR